MANDVANSFEADNEHQIINIDAIINPINPFNLNKNDENDKITIGKRQ